MANKFPLIADGSAIKELPSGDNLDLTGSGISISGGQGTSGQVLQSNGSTVVWADAGGGGGAWNVVSSTTLSSAVTSVELTLSGYDSYEIRFDKIDPAGRTQGGVAEYLRVFFSTNGGTSYSTNVKHQMRNASTRNTTTQYYWYGSSYSGQNTTNYIDLMDFYKSSSYDHAVSGVVTLENNSSGTAAKHGQFRLISTRDYSSTLHQFIRDGEYGVSESNAINKVKFDFSGGASVPSGSRFTVYGLATS